MIANENEVLEAVEIFRKNWRTTGGHLLSLDSNLGEMETRNEAVLHACAPAVRRALSNPLKINTRALSMSHQFMTTFDMALSDFLKAKRNFDFERWEKDLADYIRNYYRKAGLSDFTYGDAQKYINMSIKYLLSAESIDPLRHCFKICYIPIDRDIQIKAHDLLGIDYLHKNGKRTNKITSWSDCDNWDDIVDFENRVREATTKLGYYSPLMWEIEN